MTRKSSVVQETLTIHLPEESKILFVDIPNIINGEYVEKSICQLPQDNQFHFPAFPGVTFSLIGVVCHIPDHYYAYVRKHGEWFIVDCMMKPHVKLVNRQKFFMKMDNVSIMMFERV